MSPYSSQTGGHQPCKELYDENRLMEYGKLAADITNDANELAKWKQSAQPLASISRERSTPEDRDEIKFNLDYPRLFRRWESMWVQVAAIWWC
ncbi:MAG: hypothetical protein AAGA75_28845 [Cyanobacteria bacterium P01_E01_bin.6]